MNPRLASHLHPGVDFLFQNIRNMMIGLKGKLVAGNLDSRARIAFKRFRKMNDCSQTDEVENNFIRHLITKKTRIILEKRNSLIKFKGGSFI